MLGMNMWSLEEGQVVHATGLVIEVIEGSFANPMELSLKGEKDLSAPELAMLIREGMDYAIKQSKLKASTRKSIPVPENKPKRPILKLKR